jgi:hypothetical protein
MENEIKKLEDYTTKIVVEKQETKNSFVIVIMIFFSVIIFGLLIFYAIDRDAFKSVNNITQDVKCAEIPACNCPNITIPSCPINSCVFNFSMPNNITFNMKNQS